MKFGSRVEVDCGSHSVFAEMREAKGRGRDLPAIVLLNGLSDTMESWDPFLKDLRIDGRALIRLDFRGQGQSLRTELARTGQFNAEVTVEEQAADLMRTLAQLGVDGPIDLVASSYGGGIAMHFSALHPQRVHRLVLFVPYVIRLDQALPVQRLWARQWEWMDQLGGVFAHAAISSGRRHYQSFLTHYMNYRYGNALTDEVARSAAIHLTFGIMKFSAFEILSRLPDSCVHLITVGRDTLVPPSLYHELWSKIPQSARASWLYVPDGEHLILQQAPLFCASWVARLLAGDPEIAGSKRFRGETYAFEAALEGSPGVRVAL